jgi:dTMP kinase
VKRGKFIVLEGPDKSGKSTHALRLATELRSRGFEVVHTREPGGTAFAEAVRRILLSNDYVVHPLAEILLYEAARAQHTHDLILPALKRGSVVLCERYTMATLAYQGGGRGLSMPMVRSLNRIATSGLIPDLTIVLDIPESCLKTRDPKRVLDRLEKESAAFHRRVRGAYRKLARREPKTRLVDADRPKEAVHKELRSLLDEVL